MGDDVELVVVVRLGGFVHQLAEPGDEPAVKLGHIRGRGQVLGIKVHEVIQHELAGVAELEIVLRKLLEDLR